MKAYTDIFGKKFTKHDVQLATSIVLITRKPYAAHLRRYMKVGFLKASRLISLMRDAGIVANDKIVIRNEDAAINAALRQLKKGRK